MYNDIAQCATSLLHRQRPTNLYIYGMDSIPARLKAIRLSASPELSVRKMAEELGYGDNHNKYAYYENETRFRKEALPVHLARDFAEVFEQYGIDREAVMALARIDDHGEVGAPGRISPKILDQLNLAEVPDASHNYAMGEGAFLDVGEVAYRYFDQDWLRSVTSVNPAGLVFVRGLGDSMLPTIHEDDGILVNTGEFIIDRQDKIWAFTYGGLGMIKRVRKIPSPDDLARYLIISDNPTIENFEVTAEEIAVRGRVVWISRRL